MAELRTPVRNVPLAHQLAGQLQEMITAGRWPVGTKIPTEHELVRRFGVSRNTVREAVRSLVHARLLESRVGDGTYVRCSSALEHPLVERAGRADLAETFELRAILEQQAARLAARRRTAEDTARLRVLLAAQQDAAASGDHAAFAAADTALHQGVVAAAHNGLLAEVYQHLGTALATSITAIFRDGAVADEQQRHHTSLVNAVLDGDPDAAEAAAARLLEVSRKAAVEHGGAASR